ncbi:glycosyltransferase family 2 protein [Hymenobacter crusticola]|nr:glycosyltransferase [Hymenobacter crusticola]
MPAYNAGHYIAQSIESVLAQLYTHWELIVVDDGSTDATRTIVEEYCHQDPRIKYVYQTNARQGRARNNGIAKASGEYIAFLDADDLWLPTKLSVQVQALEAEEADLVFSNTYVFHDELTLNDSTKTMQSVPGLYVGEAGLQVLLQYNSIPILTVLATRSAIERAGGFTELLPIQNAEDYHLWLKMLLTGSKLVCIPGIYSAYREHGASVSSTNTGRFNLTQAVEALSDLYFAYPAKRQLLKAGLVFNIKRSLDQLTLDDPKFPFVIATYLRASDKRKFGVVFSLLELAKLRRLSLKALYFVLNYL